MEHSTVKIQSNFTAPHKSGKMSAKRAGVRKTSTDTTATHSNTKKVEEKRKSEEKVSAEKEEQTKLSEKVKILGREGKYSVGISFLYSLCNSLPYKLTGILLNLNWVVQTNSVPLISINIFTL